MNGDELALLGAILDIADSSVTILVLLYVLWRLEMLSKTLLEAILEDWKRDSLQDE